MKSIKIISFLLVISQFGFAQNTIYEAFNIEKMDCKVDTYIEETEEIKNQGGYISFDEEYFPEPKATVLNALDSLEMQFVKNFQKTSKLYSPQSTSEVTYPLKNGDFCFRENGKWGVKKASGKIKMSPQFDFVRPDTFQFGFVGYKNEKCNYYVTKKYKKAFKQDYYYVEAMKNGSFIVQTEDGFGILNSKNKWVLTPDNYSIKKMSSKEGGVYSVFDAQINRFVFVEKNKKRFYPRGYSYTTGFHTPTFQGDFLVYSYLVLKTKTGEQFFCHPEFSTDVVNEDAQLVFVKKEYEEDGGYLSDFNGKLISTQKFQDVKSFNKFNQAIASIENPKKGKPLLGVIDAQGKWIILPEYKKIEFKYDHYMVASMNAKTYGVQGVYDTRGKMIVEPADSDIYLIKEDMMIQKYKVEKKYSCDVFTFPENKLLQKDLPFSSLSCIKLCDGFVFFGYNQSIRKYKVMDENFNPIASNLEKISYGDGNLTTTFETKEGKTAHQTFLCGKELRSIKFNNEVISDYQTFANINEELTFITLLNDESYFIYPEKTMRLRGKLWEVGGTIASIYPADYKDLLIVIKNQKYSMVNMDGEIILPNIFTHLSRFDKRTGLARFGMGAKNGFITQEGKFLFGQRFDTIEYLDMHLKKNPILNLFKVTKGDYQGVVNRDGKVIVPLQKHFISLSGGLVVISKNMEILKSFSQEGREILK